MRAAAILETRGQRPVLEAPSGGSTASWSRLRPISAVPPRRWDEGGQWYLSQIMPPESFDLVIEVP